MYGKRRTSSFISRHLSCAFFCSSKVEKISAFIASITKSGEWLKCLRLMQPSTLPLDVRKRLFGLQELVQTYGSNIEKVSGHPLKHSTRVYGKIFIIVYTLTSHTHTHTHTMCTLNHSMLIASILKLGARNCQL